MDHPTRPQPRHATTERERMKLEGALELLDLLREELVLRADQARDESWREPYDEMLTHIDSLLVEYRRRRDALPPPPTHHASYVFLLDDRGTVHPLPHRVYVALVRGEAATPQFAGQTLRLAEWYVRLQAHVPETVVNETYVRVSFDAEGRVDWAASPGADETAAWPSADERTRMQATLFEGRPAG